MKLQEFQDNIIDSLYQINNKEKFKNYHYTIIGLTEALSKVEQAYVYNYSHKVVIIKELGNTLSYSIKLLKDLDFPITSESFSLEIYKENIQKFIDNKNNNTFDSLLQSIRFVFGLTLSIIKNSIEGKRDLTSQERTDIINQVIDINIKLFTIIQVLGLNINIILEKEVEERKKIKNIDTKKED